MKKYIHLKKEDREFIAKAFGVTERSVYNALKFVEGRGETDLAKRIQTLAMERGGILMTVSPAMETLHDNDNIMYQYFPNGALIEFSKTDGSGTVIFKGTTVRKYDNVKLSDIPGIQNYASNLK